MSKQREKEPNLNALEFSKYLHENGYFKTKAESKRAVDGVISGLIDLLKSGKAGVTFRSLGRFDIVHPVRSYYNFHEKKAIKDTKRRVRFYKSERLVVKKKED